MKFHGANTVPHRAPEGQSLYCYNLVTPPPERSLSITKLLPSGRLSTKDGGRMSRHANLRAIVASSLFGAFLFALTLAASPQLHARIHPDAGSPNHECAVTLLATGKYQQADAPPVFVAPQPAVLFEKISALAPVWVAAPFLGARVFE
ncbi:MAG: hypothetical protein ACREP1_03930, partial [Rhodanobacteraceae bacterium]